MKLIETNDEFTTWEEQPYGKISIYNNDYWFINSFRGMSDRIPYSYQADRDMQMVKKHIPKYKNIIENLHEGIIILNEDLNIIYLNNFINPSLEASQTPFSVISPVTYFAGVTSKAKFNALLFLG